MKYDKAIEYIEECNKAGIVPGLDSIKELCARLGNPQDSLKFIHIAGTNGKGSTLAYISTILKTAGYKVGRYVSPTIRTYLERFQIGGRAMSQASFGSVLETVKEACESMVRDGLPHPTAFEVETAVAFLYFLEKKCDIVVIECGMGGLEDATNIIKTTVMEVFAHIDMDHMQYLGDNITKIAYNKAGIIKPGSKVVAGLQCKEVKDVLTSVSADNNCELTVLDATDITKIRYGINGQSFSLKQVKYKTPLLGVCQVDNAALAVLAVKTFDTSISDEIINKGLSETVWPARLQVLNKKPLLVIDGAHNVDAALRLKESVDIYFKDKRKIFIMGMFRDKAVEEVVDIMCPLADMVLTIATPGNPRALSSVELATIVRDTNQNVTSLDSVEEALEMAKMFADDNTLILAFGSLSYLGRILDIEERHGR